MSRKLTRQAPSPDEPPHPVVLELARILADAYFKRHNGQPPQEPPTNDNDPRRHLRKV
jgi:hypothetical protein